MFTSKFLYKLYKIPRNRLRRFIIRRITRKEKGVLYSQTLRRIFRDYHDIEIGLYTMGGCFNYFQVDRYTKIGRYCSFAESFRIMNRNHPLEYKSTHAFFFNPLLKICKKDEVEYVPLTIGNDVWIGHNAIIMPSVTMIGDGAVIGAGAVVNKDIPPYAIVVGNPARVVRYRFPPAVIEKLLESRWWDKSIGELEKELDEFTKPYYKTEGAVPLDL